MKKRILSILLCMCMLFATSGTTVFAVDISGNITSDTVWNDGDVVSNAVTIAGGTAEAPVVVTVNGTVTLANTIKVTSGYVRFTGGGTLLRDTSNTNNMLQVDYNGHAVLDDITLDGNNIALTNGENSAVVLKSESSLTLNDGAVIQNSVKQTDGTGGGAAIYARGTATIVMNGGSLRNNTSYRRGGAVYLDSKASMTLNGGEITGNKADPPDSTSEFGGGGIYIRDASFTMTGGYITNNSATYGYGGGIYNTSYGSLSITGGTISGNSSGRDGDGIYHSSFEGSDAVLRIGGDANIKDEIYLSDKVTNQFSKITAPLKNNIKFTVEGVADGRVISEGEGYTLTYADMAKMNVTNSNLMLRLENNQISLSNTSDTYLVYFAYDANGGSANVPASEEITVEPSLAVPTRTVDFSTVPTREGYVFLGWDTNKNATTPTYTQAAGEQTITLNDNVTLYAIWEAVPTYMITAVAEGNGEVNGGGEVAQGGNIILTATADEGYVFAGWYEGEAKVSDTAEFVVENVTADKTYTAKFTKDTVYYTITAIAETGGTISGGGEVVEGGSVSLIATANEGYTFDGWYDGDLMVSDSVTFIVENVTANKTYTAKFKENETEDPNVPVSKNPEITAVNGKLVMAANGHEITKVSIAYIGTKAKTIANWTQFEAAGKEYADVNGSIGCKHYSNVADGKVWSMENGGYYAIYIKAADLSSIYLVKEVTLPDIIVKDGNLKLSANGATIKKVSIAYIGTEAKAITNWTQFEAAGKEYADVNGSAGCKHYSNVADGKVWSMKNSGYYAIYINAADYSAIYLVKQLTLPSINEENGRMVLSAEGANIAKVSIAYIGTEPKAISDWTQFETAGKAYTDVNGSIGCKHYNDVTDGYTWTTENAGYYAYYIRANGYSAIYSQVYIGTPVVAPSVIGNGDNIVLSTGGNSVSKVSIAYIGTTAKTIKNWTQFETAGKAYTDVNGSIGCKHYSDVVDGQKWTQETSGYYAVYIKADGFNSIYNVVYIGTPAVAPEMTITDGTMAISANNNEIAKVSVAYIGTEAKTVKNWTQFETAGKAYTDVNGSIGCKHYNDVVDGHTWSLENPGYYAVYIKYVNGAGITKSLYLVLDGNTQA